MPNEPKKLVGGGLFQDFEWLPDSYDNCKYKSNKLVDMKQKKEEQKLHE